MAIIATSTTATEAELAHAVSPNWREPFIEPAAAPPAAAEGEEGTALAPEEGGEGTEKKPSQEKNDDPAKKSRMARLHDRLDGLERRLEERDAEIARLRAGERAPANGEPVRREAPAKASEADPKPKATDAKYANDYEQFIEDLSRWGARQERAKAEAEAAQQTERERASGVFERYNAQLEAVRTAHPDFDEVMAAPDVKIPEALTPAILEAPNGPEIAYYLLSHPEEAQKLSEMSLAAGAVEIGRLSHQLKPNQQAAAPAKRNRPAPPAPIAPPAAVAATSVAKGLDEVPYAEFKRRRRNGEIA